MCVFKSRVKLSLDYFLNGENRVLRVDERGL